MVVKIIQFLDLLFKQHLHLPKKLECWWHFCWLSQHWGKRPLLSWLCLQWLSYQLY